MKDVFNSLTVFMFVLVMVACNDPKPLETAVDTEFGNLPAALIDSLKPIGAPMQMLSMDAGKDNVLKGKSGTTLYVPANSLLDVNGKPVSGTVTLELKEHFSMADYVASNLQTVHGEDILQTQGMIYFSAKDAAGAKLSIDKNKPIRIEIPVKEADTDAKIFLGQRDADGRMDWTNVEEPNKLLIPYPIRALAAYQVYGECPQDFGFLREDDPRWSQPKNSTELYYTPGDITQYENTLLATREFRERFRMHCMPYITNVYLEHLELNLWEIDELMVDYYIADSIARVGYEVEFKPRSLNGGPPSKEQVALHQRSIEETKENCHRYIQTFREFAAQKLTKIDESRKVPADLLAEVNNDAPAFDSAQAIVNSAYIAYEALEFGWVNVDVFFKDPAAVPIQLFAETNRPSDMVQLIFPARNIVLSGSSVDGKRYSFTQTTEGYHKLPKGEKATLLCLHAADGKLFFAKKDIVIGQNQTEKLDLVETSVAKVKEQLATLGS
jgi:hypothetical protein